MSISGTFLQPVDVYMFVDFAKFLQLYLGLKILVCTVEELLLNGTYWIHLCSVYLYIPPPVCLEISWNSRWLQLQHGSLYDC